MCKWINTRLETLIVHEPRVHMLSKCGLRYFPHRIVLDINLSQLQIYSFFEDALQTRYYMRFDLLTAVVMKTHIFCNITLCRLVNIYLRFEETQCLYLQGQAVQHPPWSVLPWRWRRSAPSRLWQIFTSQHRHSYLPVDTDTAIYQSTQTQLSQRTRVFNTVLHYTEAKK